MMSHLDAHHTFPRPEVTRDCHLARGQAIQRPCNVAQTALPAQSPLVDIQLPVDHAPGAYPYQMPNMPVNAFLHHSIVAVYAEPLACIIHAPSAGSLVP